MLQRARHHDARWPDGDLVEVEPAAVATTLLERCPELKKEKAKVYEYH